MEKKLLLISILIIAILIGISFIFIFGKSFSKSKDCFYVQDEDFVDIDSMKKCIKNEIILDNKKIYFPKSEITLEKGGAIIFNFGLINKKDSPLHYRMRFTPLSNPNGFPFSIDNPSWFIFGKNYTLARGELDIRAIRLTIPKNAQEGSYFLTFEVLDDDLPPPNNIYAQNDFIIKVTIE